MVGDHRTSARLRVVACSSERLTKLEAAMSYFKSVMRQRTHRWPPQRLSLIPLGIMDGIDKTSVGNERGSVASR
jgi:hypothetical protein